MTKDARCSHVKIDAANCIMGDELNYSGKELKMVFHKARKLTKAYVKDRNVNTLTKTEGIQVQFMVQDRVFLG